MNGLHEPYTASLMLGLWKDVIGFEWPLLSSAIVTTTSVVSTIQAVVMHIVRSRPTADEWKCDAIRHLVAGTSHAVDVYSSFNDLHCAGAVKSCRTIACDINQ